MQAELSTPLNLTRQPAQGPSASALAASHLEKKYGKRRVVDDVGLHVEKGEVVGLLEWRRQDDYVLYDRRP